MPSWLRSLILIGTVSFFLGVWFHLRKFDQGPTLRFSEVPEIVLLTDEPSWWAPVVEMAATDSVARIKIQSPPRREWEAYLRQAPAKCTLVAFKSYFQKYFADNHLLQSFAPQWDPLFDQVSPDFQVPLLGRHKSGLPLLWSTARWKLVDAKAGSTARMVVESSLDDALLIAYDFNLVDVNDEDPDTIDWPREADKVWSALQSSRIAVRTSQPEFAVPEIPISAIRQYDTRPEDMSPTITSIPGSNAVDLWTYNIGVCPGQQNARGIEALLAWLVKSEASARLTEESHLASTVLALDHGGSLEPHRQPSALRHLPLARLRHRELDWPLAVAWEESLRADKSPSQPPRKSVSHKVESLTGDTD
jgi:hypothetical protein